VAINISVQRTNITETNTDCKCAKMIRKKTIIL
jgi:hypothetical protein